MSRIFDHFNDSTYCPICLERGDGKAVLVPIAGRRRGGCAEAVQVHLDCLLKCIVADLADGLIYAVAPDLKGARESGRNQDEGGET